MTIEELLERVYANCIPDEATGCMAWTGAVRWTCNNPSIRREGGNSVSLRRYMLEVANEKKPCPKRVATYICGNPKCVKLEHIAAVTRTVLQTRVNSEMNAFQKLRKAKRSSAKRRLCAKLTPEIVKAIKESNEPQKLVAQRYGVVQSTISQIKRGVTWKDYDNPFTRLAA